MRRKKHRPLHRAQPRLHPSQRRLILRPWHLSPRIISPCHQLNHHRRWHQRTPPRLPLITHRDQIPHRQCDQNRPKQRDRHQAIAICPLRRMIKPARPRACHKHQQPEPMRLRLPRPRIHPPIHPQQPRDQRRRHKQQPPRRQIPKLPIIHMRKIRKPRRPKNERIRPMRRQQHTQNHHRHLIPKPQQRQQQQQRSHKQHIPPILQQDVLPIEEMPLMPLEDIRPHPPIGHPGPNPNPHRNQPHRHSPKTHRMPPVTPQQIQPHRGHKNTRRLLRQKCHRKQRPRCHRPPQRPPVVRPIRRPGHQSDEQGIRPSQVIKRTIGAKQSRIHPHRQRPLPPRSLPPPDAKQDPQSHQSRRDRHRPTQSQ